MLGITEKQTNQIKPELCLEAKMTTLRVSYFECILRRQDSLEKTIMLGKVEGNRKRGGLAP